MPETQGNQSGSCEACKKKKCKCDRTLPVCRQCASSQQACKYAENNKRGIPGGYLGALEARLNETEIAFYNALCELQRLKSENTLADHTDLSEPLQARQADANKYSRMTEWTKYPLKQSDDIKSWWKSVNNNKLLKNSRGDQTDFAIMFNSERSLDLASAGVQYQEQERQSPEAINGQPSSIAVLFDMVDHNMVQDFQPNFQSEMAALKDPLVSRGIVAPNSARDQHSSYENVTYSMNSLSGQVSNWNRGLGEEETLERGEGVGSTTNRSQELSSRLKHKYY